MAHIAVRPGVIRVAAAAIGAALSVVPWPAHADAWVYVNNINGRGGYNFPTGDAAVAYGQGVCDKVGAGRRYGQLVHDVQTDLNFADDYQANYLIGQAVNELCPELIQQLRDSAGGYRPGAS